MENVVRESFILGILLGIFIMNFIYSGINKSIELRCEKDNNVWDCKKQPTQYIPIDIGEN